MKTKYSNYCSDFESLYYFIDDYISQNINTCKLDEEWTWLLIPSTKYIKNFDLDKTFGKFKFKIKKNDLNTNFRLIAYLSKKIKHCNAQEHYLILDIIYNILINIDNIDSLVKSEKYSEEFKKLKRGLSYLSFNINYSYDFSKNSSLIDNKFVSDKLFKISNLLFIDSIDEYFWIPKRLKSYESFTSFIALLDDLFNKILYKQSLYSDIFLFGAIKVKAYINKLTSTKNKTKKEKEKDQYILILEYFSKLELPNLYSIVDLKKISIIKEYIFSSKLIP